MREKLDKLLEIIQKEAETDAYISKTSITKINKLFDTLSKKEDEKEKIRTDKQNKAYWVFQKEVANEMRQQGKTMKDIAEVFEVEPTDKSLHEFIFKRILENKFNKTSTTQMTRQEMNGCLDNYMYILANLGVEVEFPNEAREKLLEFYN